MLEHTYLKLLPISEEAKQTLDQLDAESEIDLLARIEAVPEDFSNFLGAEPTQQLREILRAHITERERLMLDAPLPQWSTGALVEAAPQMIERDTSERDALFEEIQRLKQESPLTHTVKQRIAMLEKLLKGQLERPHSH